MTTPYETQMKAIEDLTRSKEEDDARQRGLDDTAIKSQALGSILQNFLRPAITASEIRSRTRPYDQSEGFAERYATPANMASNYNRQNAKDLLNRYSLASDLARNQPVDKIDQAQKMADIDVKVAEQKEGLKTKSAKELIDYKNAKEGGKDGKKPEKFASTQYAAAGFASRLEQSDKIMNDLMSAGYDRTKVTEGLMASAPDWANVIKSPELKQQTQAERNFVNATLRRESGAAISADEFAKAELTYFPRAGDDPGTLKNKAESRKRVIAQMKAEAKGALDEVKAQLAETKEYTKPPISGVAYAAPTTQKSVDDMSEAELDAIIKGQ